MRTLHESDAACAGVLHRNPAPVSGDTSIHPQSAPSRAAPCFPTLQSHARYCLPVRASIWQGGYQPYDSVLYARLASALSSSQSVHWQGAVEMQPVPGHFAGGPGGPYPGPKSPPDSGSTHAQIIGSPDGLPNGRAHLVGLLSDIYLLKAHALMIVPAHLVLRCCRHTRPRTQR